MTIISHLVAMSENRVIGKDNDIPWRLPRDVAYFKEISMGKPIVMGRLTWESLPRKPLPGRRNIVITRDPAYPAAGADVVTSLDQALSLCEGAPEVVIIGGAQIFAQSMPVTNRLYLSLIHKTVEGDVFYPAYDERQWRLVRQEQYLNDGPMSLDWDFLVYDRIDPASP